MRKFGQNILVATLAIFTFSLVALNADLSMSSQAQAQSPVYFVHNNCNTSPCTIGVNNQYYATPGNARYSEGWRRLSQSYRDSNRAWRTACNWHYSNPRYSSPDIAADRVSCAALCPNGQCRTR